MYHINVLLIKPFSDVSPLIYSGFAFVLVPQVLVQFVPVYHAAATAYGLTVSSNG